MAKNLLIRMDKIGDLVLTMPVDQFLGFNETLWFIAKGLEFFPQHSSPARKYVSFQKNFALAEFMRMLKEIRRINPDRAIIFHAPWWVALALIIARVPLRVGAKSKWYSFLFFNKSIRQKRSQAKKHEAQYGLELLGHALGKEFSFSELEPLVLTSGLSSQELENWQLTKNQYIVVHPGMAGSALNWPIQKYIEFIREISKSIKVVVTCGPTDHKYVEPIKVKFQGDSEIKILEELSLKELMVILENSRGVLAPSTGVLHLAASAGVPTLGIYSPVGVERSIRWGPRGKQVDTLTPSTNDNNFNRDNIMDSLAVQTVLKKFKEKGKIQ